MAHDLHCVHSLHIAVNCDVSETTTEVLTDRMA